MYMLSTPLLEIVSITRERMLESGLILIVCG
jgi:hypothetical protein